MSISYKQLVRKADLALSDLTSGGLLQPEQSNRFMRKVIEAPTLLNEVRFVPMSRPQMEINKVGFSNRILRVANQGVISSPRSGEEGTRALARADRIKPELSKLTLSTDEVIAEIDLPYEVLEDNIEKEGFQDTLLDMIAQAAARDLEEKLILSDPASGDPYLALQYGILSETTSNVVNHGGAAIGPGLFEDMLTGLPTRYHRFLNDMRFYVATTREINLRAQIAQRQTSLGDATLTGYAPVQQFGVQVKGVSQMPVGSAILLNPKNLIWGVQRNIRMEMAKDIRERAIIIVLTMRIAHRFEEEDMVVKAINIGA